MTPDIWTYADAISHCIDYMGSSTSQETERYARRAVQLAYKEMASKRNWNYFYHIGHVTTVADYSTGTIAYDHTGGAQERMVTLTTGTWPSWAADGMLDIDNIFYPCTRRISDTVITLADANNPGADVAAGTEYTIAREHYTLPVDFGAMDRVIQHDHSTTMTYLPPGEFFCQQRTSVSVANPWSYTITNDPNRHGAMAIRFYPVPDEIYQFGFYYRRRPRTLKIDNYSTGTVSTTSGQTTLTGSGTVWNSTMIGSIVRFAADAVDVPTGLSGASPFWLERSITAYTSATSLTLDQDPQQSLSGVKYSISDPVDIESGAMLSYFLRECERQCRLIRRMEPSGSEDQNYALSYHTALEADNRRLERQDLMFPRRLADMPLGDDVE
jgi:hypothetical protein